MRAEGPSTACSLAPEDLSPERLCERYRSKIDRHVRYLLGRDDEHEDLVQDVLMAVLRGSASVRDATRLDAWVAQVTVNTVNSVLRQRKWRRHLPLEALPEQQLPVLSINHDTRELASRLASLLHRLPAPDRCLLLSYWLSPATVGTLAADAGCSTGTVQRRLRRAQARFDRLVQHDRPILTCLGVEGGGALTSAANDDAPRPKLAIARGALSAVRRRRPALRAVT